MSTAEIRGHRNSKGKKDSKTICLCQRVDQRYEIHHEKGLEYACVRKNVLVKQIEAFLLFRQGFERRWNVGHI